MTRSNAPSFLSTKLSSVVIAGLLLVIGFENLTFAREYHIGPGKQYPTPYSFPWEGILPGDVVNIHWREKPYKSKWAISQTGTPEQPVVVQGIRGPKGQRPVIEGRGALTRPQLSYTNGERSLIKIGASRTPDIFIASYLLLQGLEVRGARPGAFYIDSKGVLEYTNHAAGIFVEAGDHVTIRDCLIHDCGNGLFVTSECSNILIDSCEFRDNGVEGRYYEHNVYTASKGMTFQFNRFGPLRKGCGGNNLKDRSSGLVVRYNWIEGGNRQMDLVDAEDSAILRNDPAYQNTLVYGNILIERPNDGNNQMIHYGGDSGEESWYRNGTLYFYHNTIVSYRPGKTVLFRLSTNAQHVDCRNNIYYTPAEGSWLAILDEFGRIDLRQNWIKKGWVESHAGGGEYRGSVTVHEIQTGLEPGFMNPNAKEMNFQLKKNSPCREIAIKLQKELLPGHQISAQFKKPAGPTKRTDVKAPNLGAFGN